MTKSGVSKSLERSVFYPTCIAYFLVVVGYLGTGLAVYLAFVIIAYWLGWFRRITEWPLVLKIILACGPPLLGLGYLLSRQNFTVSMLLPGIIYYVVGAVGALTLLKRESTRP
jgi:hypothetical protein